MAYRRKKKRALFEDDDRRTKRHEEMALWFTDNENVKNFLKLILNEEALSFKTTIERPIFSKSNYLYGFADVIIEYKTPAREHQVALIELKTYSPDFGQTLRQIKTYQKFIEDVKHTVLIDYKIDDSIYEAPGIIRKPPEIDKEKRDDKYEIPLKKFFGSQGIIVKSFEGLKNDIKSAEDDDYNPPEGIRFAIIEGLNYDIEDKSFFIDFSIYTVKSKTYPGTFKCYWGPNFFDRPNVLLNILKKLDFDVKLNEIESKDKDSADYPNFPGGVFIEKACYIELTYKVNKYWAYLTPFINAIYYNDKRILLNWYV